MMREWLESLGLGKFVALFEENEVDFETLRGLTEQDLADLGLGFGPRRKLLNALAETKIGNAGSPASSVEGERRQLTVMFCDLVGSTALSERLDPEELRAVIRAYQDTAGQVIAKFEGHIAQYLGDGLLVYFGHPLAHEDDAARAVHAGLGIVTAMNDLKVTSGAQHGQLSVRIGIHTGLVVVGEIGGGERREQLALGDTPNLAARLQALAAPDTVVISEQTRRLAGGGFEYADLGEQSLKGIAEPVRIWQTTGVSAVASRFEAATQGALTPLVGREQEMALLLERWQLTQGGAGQVVLLSGEPGIGKSRALGALRERLHDELKGTLLLQCSPYYVNSAFYSTIDNFERALKFGRDESAASKLDKLEALLVGRYRLPLDDVRFIATIMSLPWEARYAPLTLTPQRQKDETIRTLVDIVEAAARLEPTLMLFEDAHWADPTSLEVLDLLVQRVAHMPLLVVLTYRPEFQSRWSQHGHVTALNLSKLTPTQSTAMVSRLAHAKALPGEVLEQILAKTDGVPLYVEELTKSILESGSLKDAGDRYEYAGAVHAFTVPATLRDSLVARLDRDAAAKEIAQIGAVIGREFSYELIAAVASRATAELDRALAQLTDSGLAFRHGIPPEVSYTFKHALVQEAAYDSLLKSRRRTLHAAIATVIDDKFPTTKDTEPELLAHHLTAAGEAETAIGYWYKAGALARKRLTLNEALSHLNQGMSLIATLPRTVKRDSAELDLRILLGTTWVALGGWGAPETWANFHPALALAKSLCRHETLMPIYYGLWANVAGQGRVAEAQIWVDEALTNGDATGNPDLQISAHRAACTHYHWRGDFVRSREHGNRVLAMYSESEHRHFAELMNTDPKTVACIYASLGTWILGYPDHAARLSTDKDAHARRRGHPFDLGYSLTVGSPVWDFRCEPLYLLARVDEAERVGREHGLPLIADVLAQIYKGIAWLRAGRINEGVPLLRRAMEKYHANGGGVWMPYYRTALAEGMARGGDVTGGLNLVDESLAEIARPGWGERCHLAEALRLKGWMHAQQGVDHDAEQNYLASLEVARQQQAKSWELRTATSLARLWQKLGKTREARELLAPIYAWFTEGFDTKDLRDAKTQLALLGR